MIIVQLLGGLGNQMFQYAVGRALSLRIGEPVYYDKTWYGHVPSGDTQRPFELDFLSLPLVFAQESDIPLKMRPVQSRYDSLCRSFLLCMPVLQGLFGFPSFRIIADFKLGIRQEVFEILRGQNVYLKGYWQSEKYFKDAEDVIRNEFFFCAPPDKENQFILDKMAADLVRGVEAVSVHIRRGDYISNPITKAYHGLLPLEYYQSAMSVIEKRCPKVIYYVFSDDLDWCRDNLRFRGEGIFVDINAGKPGWMDMRLMSTCRHHIIANSSFSWWGAWLNVNKNKVVVAPQEWLSDTSLINKEMLPGDWLKISIKGAGI